MEADMTTILSIDPGKMTGLAWGRFSDTDPYEVNEYTAVEFDDLSDMIWNGKHPWADILVIERFVPQSGTDYTLKEDDLAGVEVIGMLKHGLVHDFNEVYYQLRSEKWNVPDQLLKDHGLWADGKDVNWTDGRDVNDAIIHALVLLKKKEHLPTLRKYFRGA